MMENLSQSKRLSTSNPLPNIVLDPALPSASSSNSSLPQIPHNPEEGSPTTSVDASLSPAASYTSDQAPPASIPRKRGRKPLGGGPDKRREQNRAAQKTFREKKEAYLRELESSSAAAQENYHIMFNLLSSLSEQNNTLRLHIGLPTQSLQEILHNTPLAPLYSLYLESKTATSPVASTSAATSSTSTHKPSLQPMTSPDLEQRSPHSQSHMPSTLPSIRSIDPFRSMHAIPTYPPGSFSDSNSARSPSINEE